MTSTVVAKECDYVVLHVNFIKGLYNGLRTWLFNFIYSDFIN